MEEIKRTERGWCGYVRGHQYCLFRRNTLIEYDNKKIVVATLGNYINPFEYRNTPIHDDVWYQTIAGYAVENNGYWEIDGNKQILIKSEHILQGTEEEMFDNYPLIDQTANDMHEKVIEEMMDLICEEG